MTDNSQQLLRDSLSDALVYARAGERLLGVATNLATTANALAAVVDLDPALAPEMKAANDALAEASDAVRRAMTFLDARHQAKYGGRG